MKYMRLVVLGGFLAGLGTSACDCGGEVVTPKDGGPRDGSTVGDANTGTDLTGLDLTGADLVGMDLVGMDLAQPDTATGEDGAVGPVDGSLPDQIGQDLVGHDLAAYADAAGEDTAPPTLSITGLFPSAGWRGLDVDIVITGTAILPGAVVTFAHQTQAGATGGTEVISNGIVAANGTSMQVRFPMLNPTTDRPAGPYDVTVANPAGSPDPLSAMAPYPYTVTVTPPPVVTDVTPTSAYAGTMADTVLSDRAITLRGSNFIAVPNVIWININNPNQRFAASDVNYLSDTQVVAVVPSESQAMPPGKYHVFLENPDGQGAYWLKDTVVVEDAGTYTLQQRGLFEITTIPPPVIDAIDPARPRSGQLTTPGTLKLIGKSFATSGAVVTLVSPSIPTGSCVVPEMATPTEPDSSTVLWRDLAAAVGPCGLGNGSVVAVRVTNPDGQFGTYYSLTVTANATGKLTDFCRFIEFDQGVCPGTGTALALVTGRARHDSAIGFDDLFNAHIYVAGGVGASAAYLSSVEVASVTPFGEPAQFRSLRQTDPLSGDREDNHLRMARRDHQLVRVQNHVYVIGGTVDDNGSPAPTVDVERAKILGLDSIPGFGAARYLDAAGSLPAGAWYYRVAAVTQLGEGLASRELIARTTAQGRVELSVERYPGALFYAVYRSLASDGRAQSSRLLTTFVDPGSGTFVHFADDGVGELAPAPGHLTAQAQTGSGSLTAGLLGYRVAAEVPDGMGGTMWTRPGFRVVAELQAGENEIALSWDPVPGASAYQLYRTEAGGDGQGQTFLLGTTAITGTSYVDAGDAVDTNTPAVDAVLPLPRGSLSRFETLPMPMRLNMPREGGEAFVLDVPVVNPLPDEPGYRTYIFMVAGRSDRTGTGTYERTTERTEVALRGDGTFAAGDLMGWEFQTVDPASPTSAHLELGTGRAYFALITNAGSHADPVPPVIEDPCAVPDRDADGYRSLDCGGTDCNDEDPRIHPGVADPCGDGIDQDCDGVDPTCQQGPCDTPQQRDQDADGHDSIHCGGDDCDDTNNEIYPGRPEICGDGIDQDCSGADLACVFDAAVPDTYVPPVDGAVPDTYVPPVDGAVPDTALPDTFRPDTYVDPCGTPALRDQDGDGYDSEQCGGTDCNDGNRNINPGVVELPWPMAGMCNNNIDEDCDGFDTVCIQGFTAPPTAGATLVENGEQVFVAVLYGSKAMNGTGGEVFIQDGATESTWEASFVSGAGDLMSWTSLDRPNGGASAAFGLEAVLYFNFLYPVLGVNSNGSLTPQINRHPACPPGSEANDATACPLPSSAYDVEVDLIRGKTSATVTTTADHAFFSMERIYTRIFAIGGFSAYNNTTGTGTVSNVVEQAQQ